ncbi:helix-turn-helix domain-containing protein [Halomonas elongata]|uniref:DNA-binding transcriptional repressor PuuR n=1 Tax=Halomonas elongata TaxID=2746 RepID=A0A1B8P3A4_HALEL|nr:helix-turn-helix domain-containing protein [Halomonas elongata]OBX36744.1 DNA-binding transcriptional repressor PuuR [Halomonas elongata]WVI72920.1 helix-turn-helix domain-containing protein [Halomonas elongata]
MEDISRHIAVTLRALREQRGWSLDRTARETGVSKAMLGQIERGESSPTVATLWKLASGFRVSFSGLLGGGSAPSERVRHGAETVWGEDAAGMQVEPLFPFDPLLGFELFVITLAPGAISESAPHAPGVVEHLVVIEGALEMRLDDDWQRLETGEGLRFAADRPHAYRNAVTTPTRFHNVIHYPRDIESLND